LQLLYFAVTLFVSAFLLFLVQPMIGKMILPRLGGTPQVWNTCVMFFQTVLLAGYAYTHNVTSKLPVRKQLLVHSIALLLPIVVLFVPAMLFGQPLFIGEFGAEGGGNPIFITLGLLTLIIGIPFLVVSTTAPLLQRWFASTGHPAAKDPYFLYGASNAGSILGLVLYPLLVERYLGLHDQAWFWTVGYVVLAGLVAGCAFLVLKAPATVQLPGAATEEPPPAMVPEAVAPAAPAATKTAVTATPPAAPSRPTSIRRAGKQRARGARGALPPRTPAAAAPAAAAKITQPAPAPVPQKPFEMTPMRRLRWVGLAAVPSSLMLGVTSYISTDISPIPMLWVFPLTLYLLSFVCVFARWPVPWVGAGINDPKLTPHKVCLFLQPVAMVVLLLVIMRGGYSDPEMAIVLCWLSFFAIALACHGELAADRPPAKHLTEFYLWMSVGGMLGGTFNALIAPLIPWFGLFEFPLAIVLSGVVRPWFRGEGWTDNLLGAYQSQSGESISLALDFIIPVLILAASYFIISHAMDEKSWAWDNRLLTNPNPRGGSYSAATQGAIADENSKYNSLHKFFHRTLGFGPGVAYTVSNLMSLILTYGIMMGCAIAGWKRPIRMALGLGAVFLGNSFYEASAYGGDARQTVLYRDRSYFGILKVIEEHPFYEDPKTNEKQYLYKATTLLHGTTHHGLNYQEPKELNRLATTYYHRYGPTGNVMERLNWFPGVGPVEPAKDAHLKTDPTISEWSDTRLPVSVIGSAAPNFGINLPVASLVSVWSEPPYATIGLGTGTMASYGRPYQHVAFYEIDEHIRNFSIPPEGREAYYTYLQGAMKRGCRLEVIMGDARLTMTNDKGSRPDKYTYKAKSFPIAKGTRVVDFETFDSFTPRESYYRAMEVDAFSSDAIPVHLITKEAIEMYLSKLTPDGVLMMHTSNRHVNLVQPVVRICETAEWKDWSKEALAQNNGEPILRTGGLYWTICKDGSQKKRFSLTEPSFNGHFGSEYIMVARKQEYLPPFEWSPRQIEIFKDKKLKPVVFSEKQMKEFDKDNLPYYKLTDERDEKGRLACFFYTKQAADTDPAVYKNLSEYPHWYIPPPGTRVWTDDYSNILSVFRWKYWGNQ
jgi:hypothetical protein